MRKAATEEHGATAMRRAETTEYGAEGYGGFPRIGGGCGAIADKWEKSAEKGKAAVF